MVQANIEQQLVNGKAVFDEPQVAPAEALPEPDSWDWVFSDGSRVQVDADLLRAMVGIPSSLLTDLGPGYLEFAKNRVAEHLEKAKNIPRDDSLRAYVFQRSGGTTEGINYYHYKCDVPPRPAPPVPAAPLVPPVEDLAAKNKHKNKQPQEEITLEEIADVITQLTMQECDELATLLHARGIKAVFATFGSNNNLPASAIIRQSVPRAQAPSLPPMGPPPTRLQQVPMQKAPPMEPPPKEKRVEDKRPALPMVPRELPDTGDDEEMMWRSVYKRPIASLDILEDLTPR